MAPAHRPRPGCPDGGAATTTACGRACVAATWARSCSSSARSSRVGSVLGPGSSLGSWLASSSGWGS